MPYRNLKSPPDRPSIKRPARLIQPARGLQTIHSGRVSVPVQAAHTPRSPVARFFSISSDGMPVVGRTPRASRTSRPWWYCYKTQPLLCRRAVLALAYCAGDAKVGGPLNRLRSRRIASTGCPPNEDRLHFDPCNAAVAGAGHRAARRAADAPDLIVPHGKRVPRVDDPDRAFCFRFSIQEIACHHEGRSIAFAPRRHSPTKTDNTGDRSRRHSGYCPVLLIDSHTHPPALRTEFEASVPYFSSPSDVLDYVKEPHSSPRSDWIVLSQVFNHALSRATHPTRARTRSRRTETSRGSNRTVPDDLLNLLALSLQRHRPHLQEPPTAARVRGAGPAPGPTGNPPRNCTRSEVIAGGHGPLVPPDRPTAFPLFSTTIIFPPGPLPSISLSDSSGPPPSFLHDAARKPGGCEFELLLVPSRTGCAREDPSRVPKRILTVAKHPLSRHRERAFASRWHEILFDGGMLTTQCLMRDPWARAKSSDHRPTSRVCASFPRTPRPMVRTAVENVFNSPAHLPWATRGAYLELARCYETGRHKEMPIRQTRLVRHAQPDFRNPRSHIATRAASAWSWIPPAWLYPPPRHPHALLAFGIAPACSSRGHSVVPRA